MMKWAEIIIFLKEVGLTRLSTFNLSAAGILAGLKLRVIGDEKLSEMIDGARLILGSATLLMSTSIIMFTWFLAWRFCPRDIFLYPSTSEYLDGKKKGAASAEEFSQSFQFHTENWDKLNETANQKRKRILIGLIILYLGLSLVSLGALFLSALPVLLTSFQRLLDRSYMP